MGTSRYYGKCSRTCSQCVPSMFPVSGNTKQRREWRNKGLYREKTKCVPNVLTFFLYIALRAFFFFFSLSFRVSFFSLVKFYFFVGTVGTAGTWRSDAIAVGTFFGILGTCSHVFWEQNIGKDRWEHGNIAFWRHLQNVPTVFLVGTRKKNVPIVLRGNMGTLEWEHSGGNMGTLFF